MGGRKATREPLERTAARFVPRETLGSRGHTSRALLVLPQRPVLATADAEPVATRSAMPSAHRERTTAVWRSARGFARIQGAPGRSDGPNGTYLYIGAHSSKRGDGPSKVVAHSIRSSSPTRSGQGERPSRAAPRPLRRSALDDPLSPDTRSSPSIRGRVAGPIDSGSLCEPALIDGTGLAGPLHTPARRPRRERRLLRQRKENTACSLTAAKCSTWNRTPHGPGDPQLFRPCAYPRWKEATRRCAPERGNL